MSRSESKKKSLCLLAQLIAEGKNVTFITGAGLSAASGIPTFRGTSTSSWSLVSTEKARRSHLLKDPVRWYNEFWFQFFPDSMLQHEPCTGHEVIALLAELCTNVFVVTQNVDGLHKKSKQSWDHEKKLIECHGRLGLYKCTSDIIFSEACMYSYEKPIRTNQFQEVIYNEYQNKNLTKPLSCPNCNAVAAPMALLFDEYYDSHSFYRLNNIIEWFSKSDAIAFVGTSFSTTVTELALNEAKKRSIPVFDFNIKPSLRSTATLSVHSIAGKAEDTLQSLLSQTLNAKSPSNIKDVMAEKDYVLSLSLIKPLLQSQVTAVLIDKCQRKVHPNPNIEANIETIWNEKISQNPHLFNASKFRLHHFTLNPHNNELVFQLGLTDYRTFLGTNWMSNSKSLLIDGLLHENDTRAYLSQKLGVSCVLESSDGFIVLIQRSTHVSEGKGKVDGPGGHPEPDKVFDALREKLQIPCEKLTNESVEQLSEKSTFSNLNEATGGSPLQSSTNLKMPNPNTYGVRSACFLQDFKIPNKNLQKEREDSFREVLKKMQYLKPSEQLIIGQLCIEEIFQSILNEIVDEVNIPMDTLSPPMLMGIVEQKNSAYTPSLAFNVNCTLDAEKIQSCYKDGPLEAFESTRLIMLATNKIRSDGFRKAVHELGLVPVCAIEGSVDLWQLGGIFE